MNYCVHCMQPLELSLSSCPQCGGAMDYEAPVHHLKPGTVLMEKYFIGKALGEGGFGITYIGRDLTLDIPIAVKEYYPNGGSSRNHNYSNTVTLTQKNAKQDYEKDIQRFLTEARMLAKFSNEPGIVGVRDFFRSNATAYIVMEYLDGITLKKLIQTNGPIPMDQLMPMMKPVMKSLFRLHQQGLVHRDISPDNLMVLNNCQLKLLDFGAAREVTGEKSLSVVLKPGYAPEEQYRSKGGQGPWTDVYALCATIYKCITGKTPEESLERAYDDHLESPSKLGASITAKQEAALMKGLSIRKADRIQSIDKLLEELEIADAEGKVYGIQLSRIPEQDSENTIYQPEEPATCYESPTRYEPTVYHEPAKIMEKQTVSEPDELETSIVMKGEKTITGLKLSVMQVSEPAEQPTTVSTDTVERKKTVGNRKPLGLLIAVVSILVIAAVLILNFFGPKETITDTIGDDSYSFVRVGQIEDANRHIEVQKNVLYNQDGVALTPLGAQLYQNAPVKTVTYLDGGLYAITEDRDIPNCVALVGSDGEKLVPAEACLFEWMDSPDCRYMLVYFAQESVTPGEAFLVCRDENGVIYKTDVGGTLYSGYMKVFDVIDRQFVPDVIIQDKSTDVFLCGNNFLVGDYSNGYTLYDSSGNALLKIEGDVAVGDGIFVSRRDKTYYIHDETGTKTATLNQYIYPISGSQYVKRQEEQGYVILDKNGNAVCSEAFESVNCEFEGLFSVKQKGKWGLITADGTSIVPCQYEYLYPLTETEGYYYATVGNHYTLINKDGILMTNLDSSNYQMIYEKNGKLLVINQRAFTLERGDQSRMDLAVGLVALGSRNTGLYGVYDLFSGEMLLPQEYEEVCCCGGEYLYAYKDGLWEVYEINVLKGK